MPHRSMTFAKFIIEDQRRRGGADTELTALLNDVQTACKLIAVTVSRGPLHVHQAVTGTNVHDEEQKPLDLTANEIMLDTCSWGGQVRGMASEEMEEPYVVPAPHRRGRHLLLFDPLDGSSNIDVNVTVGTIFSILRAPEGVDEPPGEPTEEDFLRPGTEQVAAGFALYGPTTMIVVTLGAGVHGFTLDREIGNFNLTHPDMRVPEETREFAINMSNSRFWEPPVQRYVEECVQGGSGPRGKDFNMRWIASLVAEVYRILIRGGLFMYPWDTRDTSKPGRLRLLYEANPMAMILEQAGGAASTGRQRILEIAPVALHQRVPLILGSKAEVERVVHYHQTHDRGEDAVFDSPLFNKRSLFRAPAGAVGGV
ncbi:fructose-1 6-bisphosphatase [Skermanella stibiiresistens SB22]|uniref:Fructose-1,6-bisphosphatase class 1 n=1 Tax=Skermanella stibiiresistens SB22 TaxID=1385369 RepID=W9H657_9PROT|nr:class 1 fructose-bisphosphatase [Skermanella stibiiresistens]EWY39243.1 fructose-1 6-bisphosphatase [Skermanella stibiiresistens SB22]